MELITTEDCQETIETLGKLIEKFQFVLQNYTPTLNGERLLTGEKLRIVLDVSKRTLQEYRDTRQITYLPLFGKILYPETDLMKLLEENYVPRLKD